MQQNSPAPRKMHPLAEKLARGKGRGKKTAAVQQGGAVQKKQDESDGTLKRAKAMHNVASPKKAAESVTVTPAKKDKAGRIRKQLVALYPNPPIPLDHNSNFQLLIAVMLSAQVLPRL